MRRTAARSSISVARQTRLSLAGEHRRTLNLAADRLIQQRHRRLRLRLQRRPGFQLGLRPRPVARQAEQLYKRGAQIGVARCGFNLRFNARQRFIQRASRQQLM